MFSVFPKCPTKQVGKLLLATEHPPVTLDTEALLTYLKINLRPAAPFQAGFYLVQCFYLFYYDVYCFY